MNSKAVLCDGTAPGNDLPPALSDLARCLSYAAYSWGFAAGKVGRHVDTTIAGNKAKAALDRLLAALATKE